MFHGRELIQSSVAIAGASFVAHNRFAFSNPSATSAKDAQSHLESIANGIRHAYGGFGSVSKGIDSVRYEDSNDWIDSIFVFPRSI